MDVLLIRITAPHFVAEVVTYKTFEGRMGDHDEYENDCDPIVHYMREWDPLRIRDYCRLKGWRYEPRIRKDKP